MKQIFMAARSTTVNATAGSSGGACFNRAASMLMAHAKRPSTLKAKMLLRSAAALGTAQVLDSGTDATTGISWGRWSGGIATIGGVATGLASRSLHDIFSAPQTGPTTLPLTGTAVYDVAGSTRPTDAAGNVGNMNSATLNANFSARTVDATVNVTLANQTLNASATGMAIYRDMTFAANTGRSPGGGLPAPTQLNISCTPSCGGAVGSLDGFFSGRTGQGAGVQSAKWGVASVTRFALILAGRAARGFGQPFRQGGACVSKPRPLPLPREQRGVSSLAPRGRGIEGEGEQRHTFAPPQPQPKKSKPHHQRASQP